jgi:hypothetical protein
MTQPTAPVCIVLGCPNLSALSSTAEDKFWRFTTFYCGTCYEKLLAGDDLVIEESRIILERVRPGFGERSL